METRPACHAVSRASVTTVTGVPATGRLCGPAGDLGIIRVIQAVTVTVTRDHTVTVTDA